MTVEFHHGALCDSYEEQANKQGFTFGDAAEWVEKVSFGLMCAHIHGCITDAEYDKILRRFQTKILLKKIKPQERNDKKMTKEQQYWEETQEALTRIFDRCEEIDLQSGYDMLEDIQFIRGFINKHKPQESEDEKCR